MSSEPASALLRYLAAARLAAGLRPTDLVEKVARELDSGRLACTVEAVARALALEPGEFEALLARAAEEPAIDPQLEAVLEIVRRYREPSDAGASSRGSP